jgi:hypothetical protein
MKEMTMRITRLLLICLCCLISAPAVMGQAASSAARPGILGYLDPHTGAFRPATQAVDDTAEVPALTVFGGTVNLTITVTLKTTAITTVTCTGSVSVEDGITTGSPRFIDEGNGVTATGTGTTRTCKISIPYSWGLATQSSDMMSTSYTVGGSASATGTLPSRSSLLSPLDTRKVPANGTITTLTAAVTL